MSLDMRAMPPLQSWLPNENSPKEDLVVVGTIFLTYFIVGLILQVLLHFFLFSLC